VPPILTYLTAGVSLLAFLGVAFVYLRGSADKGTIESQGRLIESLTAENADLRTKTDRLSTRVTAVEAENLVLRDAVGHTEEVRALQITLDSHHQESIQAWDRMTTALERLSA
jgi:hypothetical protein